MRDQGPLRTEEGRQWKIDQDRDRRSWDCSLQLEQPQTLAAAFDAAGAWREFTPDGAVKIVVRVGSAGVAV